MSWSGGKDSALALWTMRGEGVEPVALLTTVTEDYDRISMHAVRRELLEAQAAAVGVPLVEVGIPAVCTNEIYEERMAAALDSPPLAEVEEFAFADLFLEDIRAYREERLGAIGRRASFPVWGRETGPLARTFIDAGFEATLVCVDPRQVDASFCGRAFDTDLLRDLPESADPCGENGEFHSFVTAGPIFSAPVSVEHGETVERDGFVFHDLKLAV
ncbi:MAG: adenine nucleotide alpha hydrolase [Actinobacteria bacterium]|nr:adenine nucleotide alpha hydrolase [Actinomycetota bacterium]